MPFTEEEKLVRRRIRNKIYRDSHKEEESIRRKQYYDSHKEERKIYRENNKEKIKLQKQTPSGKRTTRKKDWKAQGIILDDFAYWHDRYIQSKKCEVCNNPYKSSVDRCIDHDHDITDRPNVRQILCQACNRFDRWKNHSEWV